MNRAEAREVVPIIFRDIEKIVNEVNERIAGAQPESEIRVLGFFDLARSVDLKVVYGHKVGTEAALRFVAVACHVVDAIGGSVVQKFGDGVLCTFSNAVDAIRAALNVKAATCHLDLEASCGLTLGQVSSYRRPDGSEELFGAAVDRCARIQSVASPGQVLVDDALLTSARSHLIDLPEVLLGAEFAVEAKGVGSLKLHELSTREMGLVGRISMPFAIHVGGRPPVGDMVQFMRGAKQEIVEIGVGLTSFAKYITGQRPAEFREPLRELYSKGVMLYCYALDPKYRPGLGYLREQGDDHYIHEMKQARRMILDECRACVDLGYRGGVKYYVYRRIPAFYFLGVDLDDPINGRMLLSPYLGAHSRSAYPVQQLSRQSSAELFDKYLKAVDVVRNASLPVTS